MSDLASDPIDLPLSLPFVWLTPDQVSPTDPFSEGRYDNPHTVDWRSRTFRSDELVRAQHRLFEEGEWDSAALTKDENEFIGTLWGQPIGFQFGPGFNVVNGRHRCWLAFRSEVQFIVAKSWGVADAMDESLSSYSHTDALNAESEWWHSRTTRLQHINAGFLRKLDELKRR